MRASSAVMKLSAFALSTLCLSELNLGVSAQATKAPGLPHSKKLVGYYPSYNSRFQTPAQINYALYTDLIYFVAVPELDLSFSYGKEPIGPYEQRARDFVSQANKHHVNPLLSIAGWTGSMHMSDLTSTAAKIKTFAKVLVAYAQKFGFAGLDIDWEYPTQSGMGCNSKSPADNIRLGNLLKEIRSLWPKAQLSAAISVNGLLNTQGKLADPKEVAMAVAYLDFAHLMAYDFYGAWTSTTGPHSAFSNKCSGPNSVSVQTGLAALLKQGFKANQIVLGIPGYAHSWELKSRTMVPTRVGGSVSFNYQPTTGAHIRGGQTDDAPHVNLCGVKEDWGGVWLVNEIIKKGWLSDNQLTGKQNFTRRWDECSGVPFLTNGTIFFSYDDQYSVERKARWAASQGLAGVYFFDTLGQPDSTIMAAKKNL